MRHDRFEFEDLLVFQRALDLLQETDRLVPLFRGHRKKLGFNMLDAAGSVVYNIAESRGRRTVPDRAHFLDMANGSAHETAAGICIADRLDVGTEQHRARLRKLAQDVIAMLTTITRKLRSRHRQT